MNFRKIRDFFRRYRSLRTIEIVYPNLPSSRLFASDFDGSNLKPKIELANLPYKGKLKLRSHTSDLAVLIQIFVDSYLEIPVPIDEPQIIFDMGANIGLSSVWYTLNFPNARIIALEPELHNYKLLSNNAAPYAGIYPIRGALWSKTTNVYIKDKSVPSWSFEVAQVDDNESMNKTSTNLIPAFNLRELMNRLDISSIDILKIDIEGSELEVFSSGYHEWLPFTKIVFVEVHDWMKPGCSDVVNKSMAECGFEQVRGGTDMIFLNRK